MEKFIQKFAGNPMQVVIAGTGHRPPRLGLAYDSESNELLTVFAKMALNRLVKEGFKVVEVVSGMAQGWDQALAHAAVMLKIPFVAAVPFKGQDSKWPQQGRERYQSLLNRAKAVKVVADSYSPKAFIDRDHWMVDRALDACLKDRTGVLLALYDGGTYGGTYETVTYAEEKKLFVVNMWQPWSKLRDSVG